MLISGPFFFSSRARRVMEELSVLTHVHVAHTHSDGGCNTCWFCSDRNHKLRGEMLPQIDLHVFNRALECTLMCFAEGSLVGGWFWLWEKTKKKRKKIFYRSHIHVQFAFDLSSCMFLAETLPNMQTKHRKALPNPEFDLLTLRWRLC